MRESPGTACVAIHAAVGTGGLHAILGDELPGEVLRAVAHAIRMHGFPLR